MMNETPAPILPPPPLLPQHIITSGTRKDCVRLRGLPYEAQVENILEFLGEHAKNIVFQGVHMVYNAQVIPVKYLSCIRERPRGSLYCIKTKLYSMQIKVTIM